MIFYIHFVFIKIKKSLLIVKITLFDICLEFENCNFGFFLLEILPNVKLSSFKQSLHYKNPKLY
jgi:hypothetical protein